MLSHLSRYLWLMGQTVTFKWSYNRTITWPLEGIYFICGPSSIIIINTPGQIKQIYFIRKDCLTWNHVVGWAICKFHLQPDIAVWPMKKSISERSVCHLATFGDNNLWSKQCNSNSSNYTLTQKTGGGGRILEFEPIASALALQCSTNWTMKTNTVFAVYWNNWILGYLILKTISWYPNILLTVWLCFESSGNWKICKFLVLKCVWLFKWKLSSSTFFVSACYALQGSSNFWVLGWNLEIGHSNKSYWLAIYCGAVLFTVYCFNNTL